MKLFLGGYVKIKLYSIFIKAKTMKDINWIIKLKEEGVLIEGTKNNKVYLHLQTPCKIHLTDTAIKQLRDNYQTDQEKGGVLVAIPKRINNVTHLTINRIILLTNV